MADAATSIDATRKAMTWFIEGGGHLLGRFNDRCSQEMVERG